MDEYYYVIYMRYGPPIKSGGSAGTTEQNVEFRARQHFEQLERMYAGQPEGPTRYEVRRGKPY
ncbi:MAG: hypothetical protein IJM79_04240 [Erysipelotrichaceae bacterium]|nr:hypothetical protein [Erysipelotrichaceae bacterium]